VITSNRRINRYRFGGILLILFLVSSLLFTGCAQQSSSQPQYKVLVVHSYHESWGWNQDIQSGIIEGLSREGYIEGKDYRIKTFYMDTKITYTTPAQVKERGEKAIGLIGDYKPDMVFVNDDDALKYVAVACIERYPDDRTPFVFSGTNLDPSIYSPIHSLEKPGGRITGALERFPYNNIFSLGKSLFPQAKRILLVADSSSSSTFVVNDFKLRYGDKMNEFPLEVIGPLQLNTFEEWKATITEYQTRADILGTLTYHQLRDEQGRVVPAPEVVDWTVHNSNLPEIGILTFHAEDGFMAALGVSAYETGMYVGIMGGEILAGADPGEMSIIDPEVTELVFNLERAKMLEFDIPNDKLLQADEVFQSIGSSRY
jgi:ABC-type uncharacterized transport system substrate-binding protein